MLLFFGISLAVMKRLVTESRKLPVNWIIGAITFGTENILVNAVVA